MRREVELWIKSAEEDLSDAKTLLNNSRFFRTAFFSQQAVEKAFKALFFIIRKEDPPKIHTVTELYNMLVQAGFRLPDELERQLFILNKYYTVSRYPDAANGLPSESVDEIEAERALKIAESVVDYAKRFAERD